jgi:hypothetical protein
MKKTNISKKRLQLNRETYRRLAVPEMEHAAGGTLSDGQCTFSAICYTRGCFTEPCNPPQEN